MTQALTEALDSVLGAEPTPARPGSPAAAAPAPAPVSPDQLGLHRVPVADLIPDLANPREQLTDIADLAESIRSQGLLQPIIVRRAPEGLIVVAGHRRLAALQRIGKLTTEVIVRRDMAPDAVLAAMLVENGQRAGLDPVEEARALNRLKVLGSLTDRDLAQQLGRSQATISARLTLLLLPVEEQEALRAGQTTIGAAVHQARRDSGRSGKKGQDKNWHLSPTYELGRLARARCQQSGHSKGRRIGGTACGACWESVIRSDERKHLHDRSARTGKCALCNTPDAGSTS